MKPFLRVLLFLGLIVSLHAAAPVRDLGEGLVYIRAAHLPADLPAGFTVPAGVLDLRYASADPASAQALSAWLRSRSAAPALTFVLVNSATARVALDVLAHHAVLPGLLTLGPNPADYTPDINVPVDPDEEQRAYAALPETADIATLLDPAPPKIRHDEAAIEKAMGNAGGASDPMPGLEITPETPTDPATATPAPPVDRTLQRAVHIHRGWLALRGSR